MRIEDMKNWTVDQLKKEVVRLADEREAKQHVILNKNKKINDLQAELDKMCNYNDELKKQINPELDPAFCDAVKDIDDHLREIQDKPFKAYIFLQERLKHALFHIKIIILKCMENAK